jgi:hypothetical protein
MLEGFTTKVGRDKDRQPLLTKDENRKEAEIKVKQWLPKLS